jgi:hypothetical protein
MATMPAIIVPEEASGIVCPRCGGNTGVKDSRPNIEHTSIRRRRNCFDCKFRFSTFELLVAPGLTPEGLLNLVAAARVALDKAEKSILEGKQTLEAVQLAQRAISGTLP